MNTPKKTEAGSAIKLIVGLGNPGSEYEKTRHNAGEDFVRELAQDFGETLKVESKFFGESGRIIVNNKDVRLLIPHTYMNRSGKAIAAIAQFYKIEPESILVAHDELDMLPGVARLKIGGGHGGHNGLRDTISSLGNNKNFARLRLGIGHPGNAKLVSNYVLKKAPEAEYTKTVDAAYEARKIVPLLVNSEWSQAMNQLHTATKSD
ncbi:aminoacyl-tRNA hydrolase [Marinibactrum halimedae]|uniref:Peptidyl-tRNA hydrolase n=1 Tax=Marinibactrum halimedae TaxID=1444977 RepID=A0AA37T4I3_9GAMM|nr:aminoacyl-tRNA hydrolase [Marinibactrum halimedae]MCD9457446.1 aminoacyl-tRNA hydrolase [Marinibactrum halimedae]GLS25501.1 peptidyl-tRNA hydrolase [Marinibactrum halimedae]